jgi:hypothetical protein
MASFATTRAVERPYQDTLGCLRETFRDLAFARARPRLMGDRFHANVAHQGTHRT